MSVVLSGSSDLLSSWIGPDPYRDSYCAVLEGDSYCAAFEKDSYSATFEEDFDEFSLNIFLTRFI